MNSDADKTKATGLAAQVPGNRIGCRFMAFLWAERRQRVQHSRQRQIVVSTSIDFHNFTYQPTCRDSEAWMSQTAA